MLLFNRLKTPLLVELENRYSTLRHTLEGRPATSDDCRHGLAKGSYRQETLDRSSIVDKQALSLAIADFKSILTEINKLK